MSLFSGMKLAGSGSKSDSSRSDRATTESDGHRETRLKPSETTTLAETAKESEILESSGSIQLPFTPGTTYDENKRSARPPEKDLDEMGEVEVSDTELCKTDSSSKLSPFKSQDQSLSDDPSYDLDPIKVIGDAKIFGKKHQPAGFDLQDLDFSRPINPDPEALTQEETKRDELNIKSESSFSFITEEPPQGSGENTVPTDSQTSLDAEPSQSHEVFESEPVKSEDEFEREETRARGDDAELTLLEKFQLYQKEHSKQLHIIKKSTSDLADQMCQLAKDCVLSGRSLVEKQSQLQVLQEQQQRAVDEEDYGKAEDLHLQCRALEGEIENASSPLPCSHPALTTLLADLQSLYDQERAARQSMAQRYQELIAEQEAVVVGASEHCSQWESGQLHRLREERSELDRDLGHLHLDKEHLHKREIHLSDRIDEGTASLRQTKDSLTADRALVQDEIKDLEAQLAALRLKETTLSESILKKDREIEAVRRDFEGERLALETEKEVLEGKEVELRRRGEELKEEETRLADGMEKVKEAEASETKLLADLVENLAMENTTIKDLTDRDLGMLHTNLCSERGPATLSESRDNLLKRKKSLRQKTNEVQDVTSSLLQDQTRVVTLRQKVSDTEGHIAALNEAKQLAVSGRNFSEAKRLTDEIKKLTLDGQHIQEEMEELAKGNEERSRMVTKLRGDVERLQEAVDEEERREELSTKDKLLEHITQLREQLQDTSQTPLVQMLQRAELASSSLQVKFLCLKHRQPLPAELEELQEDFSVDSSSSSEWCERTQEEEAGLNASARDASLEGLQMELEGLESQLQEAVEQEDYDTAELLQRNIDRIQQEIQTSGMER